MGRLLTLLLLLLLLCHSSSSVPERGGEDERCNVSSLGGKAFFSDILHYRTCTV